MDINADSRVDGVNEASEDSYDIMPLRYEMAQVEGGSALINTIVSTLNEYNSNEATSRNTSSSGSTVPTGYYAPPKNANSWAGGSSTSQTITGGSVSTTGATTKVVSKSSLDIKDQPTFPTTAKKWEKLTDSEKRVIGGAEIEIDRSALLATRWPTVWENLDKRQELLNNVTSMHQNAYNFPYTDSSRAPKTTDPIRVRSYDYQIIPGDPRYSKMVSLEDKLKEARAAFGIPVHGQNLYARAMKYYMYNRFKVPDTNLLHNRSETYVFFTRPDLNIMNDGGSISSIANSQTLNHTETAMVWRRYPDLFKLLTDSSRCGDSDNFNLLLSNQVTSFDIRDEEISTVDAGKSWGEYTMPYGESYTGRTAGEFTCNFTETSDYSVINLIKLWITYIDNVGRGAWSPSYNLTGQDNMGNSHVFTKTLDYAASAYVFKCGPDGSDILYWSKYYGIFPVSTGASALTWDNDSPIGSTPKLNVRFKYAWKKDMSPVSLLEFNHNAKISGVPVFESAFNPNYAHTSRPFVGAPFIQMYLGSPQLQRNMAASGANTSIRLMFKAINQDANSPFKDDNLYRANMSGRIA